MLWNSSPRERAQRAVVRGVRSRPDHALVLMHGFLHGTTEGESVDRAIDAPGLGPGAFVRDGDLNRVDIAARLRGPLTAAGQLGWQGGFLQPFSPRSTRSVVAASGTTSRLTSVAGAPVALTSFTSALEEQGLHS